MRVVCDNCGASYKIPETKLTKEVNKATCRKCGHAIYIRRATVVAESAPAAPAAADERTLITSSADLQQRARGGFDDMAPRRAVDPASQEATLPRAEASGPDPMAHAGPSLTIVPPDQASPPTLSPAPSLSYAPPPAGLSAAPDMPTLRAERPAFQPRPAPAAEVPTERQRPAPSAERAAPERPADRPMAAERSAATERRDPPRPSPAADRGMPPVAAAPAYNPQGDLTFAMLASLLAVFGVLVLLANSLIGSVWVTAAGAFFAILGCVATVLVLVTGGRGTRSASVIASVIGGFVFAGGGAAAAVAAGTMLGGMGATEPPPVAAVAPPPEPVVAPPAAPPAVEAPPPVEAVAVAEPVAPPPEPVAVTPPPEPVKAAEPVKPAEPPKSEPKKTSTSSSSTKSSSSSTSGSSTKTSASSSTPERITPAPSTSTTSTSTSAPASTASTKTATSASPTTSSSSSSTSSSSSSAASAATGVSNTVIDTMMRSNKSVKNCFITEKNESGTLPSGVKVKFTIQPSGKVSSAAIPSGDYQGTAFDSCLSGAVKSIAFPPFTGDPVTLTYPFRL